jgi:hypothetical protein
MKNIIRTFFFATIAALMLSSGAVNAQGRCIEGTAANGECVDPGIVTAMRQSAIIFSQPKISFTAYPVLPTGDDTYRYPHQLNPYQQISPTGTPWIFSDIRLKRDITLVGHLGDGLGLYRYRYVWSDTVYVGVMAQEVALIHPEAVVRGGLDNYLRVDYGRIGLKLMTLPEWDARNKGERL